MEENGFWIALHCSDWWPSQSQTFRTASITPHTPLPVFSLRYLAAKDCGVLPWKLWTSPHDVPERFNHPPPSQLSELLSGRVGSGWNQTTGWCFLKRPWMKYKCTFGVEFVRTPSSSTQVKVDRDQGKKKKKKNLQWQKTCFLLLFIGQQWCNTGRLHITLFYTF